MSYCDPPEPLFHHHCAVTYGVWTGGAIVAEVDGSCTWPLAAVETRDFPAGCTLPPDRDEDGGHEISEEAEEQLVTNQEGSSGFCLNSGLQAPPSCARHLPPNIDIVSKSKINLEITTKQQPRRCYGLHGRLMLWSWVQVPLVCLG